MRKNKILERMREGKVAFGCQLSFPCNTLVEVMGLAELDFVLFDGEHGTFSAESLEDLCRVADLAGPTCIARVPDISSSTIQTYLDRGVMGILGPGIDTKADAEQLVASCYYAPLGKRGLGGAPRAAGYTHLANREYIEDMNSQMFVAAFLEHAEALQNLEGILSVEGIHAYYVGPQDMSLSLGLVGEPNHPNVKAIEKEIKEKVEKLGRKYLSDIIAADRATNFFLNGIQSFLNEKRGKDEVQPGS